MNTTPNTQPPMISTQMIRAQMIRAQMIRTQMIRAQMIGTQMIDAGIVSAQMSRRPVEVLADDIDATIAILDALASFCSDDPAAGRLARMFGPHVHPFELATLADSLAAMFTLRVTATMPTTRTEP